MSNRVHPWKDGVCRFGAVFRNVMELCDLALEQLYLISWYPFNIYGRECCVYFLDFTLHLQCAILPVFWQFPEIWQSWWIYILFRQYKINWYGQLGISRRDCIRDVYLGSLWLPLEKGYLKQILIARELILVLHLFQAVWLLVTAVRNWQHWVSNLGWSHKITDTDNCVLLCGFCRMKSQWWDHIELFERTKWKKCNHV